MRFNHYVLEHEYRWARGAPGHRRLFDPPMFYPARNTAAYSDLLLGLAPLYGAGRACGLAPDAALQGWILLLSVLNFGAAYLLLRGGFGISPLEASAGAFLFAFAGSRTAIVNHQQVAGQFYTVLAVHALVCLFRKPAPARILLFAACCCAQVYSGFYLGWFLALGLLFAAGWALLLPDTREPLLVFLRRQWPALLAALVLACLALYPLASHYLHAMAEVRPPHSWLTYRNVPRLPAWIYHDERSWLYGWMARLPPLRPPEGAAREGMGIGLLTPIAALLGLWWHRRDPAVRLFSLAGATFVAGTFLLAQSPPLFRLYFEHVPGAAAVRFLHRVAMMTLLPQSLGLALFVQAARQRWPRGAGGPLALLLLCCALEQGRSIPSYDKEADRATVRALAARIQPGSQAFLYAPAPEPDVETQVRHYLDAMWAGLETGVPTVNGYSGHGPPGWTFLDLPPRSEGEVSALLDAWARERGLDRKRLCWIREAVN